MSILKQIKRKIKAYKLWGYKVTLENVPPPLVSSSIYIKKTLPELNSHTTERKCGNRRDITDVAIPT